MKVAIKYCGGCKSRYDRVSLVNALKEEFSEIDFCYLKDNENIDGLIVVQGCAILCAETEVQGMEILEINPQNYEKAVELVRDYLKRRSEKLDEKRKG